MLQKIISGLLNWFLLSVILPGMAFIWDVIKLRKENKELKKNIEDLKSAKSKKDIDTAIDNLP
jgi:hypothetical protein